MARVLGSGGVFFKAKDPAALDPEGTKLELWQPKPMSD